MLPSPQKVMGWDVLGTLALAQDGFTMSSVRENLKVIEIGSKKNIEKTNASRCPTLKWLLYRKLISFSGDSQLGKGESRVQSFFQFHFFFLLMLALAIRA